MTEKEKMIAGMPYFADDEELVNARIMARRLTEQFNRTSIDEMDKRTSILHELIGSYGEKIYIEPSFKCDYGFNIHVGENFYANFDCVILDVAEVRIGKNCLIAPQVGIYTALHPLNSKERCAGIEGAKPIKIGDNCWIGGRAIINPGVTLGDNVVVASGAVVTKSFGNNVLIAGCPAKVIKNID